MGAGLRSPKQKLVQQRKGSRPPGWKCPHSMIEEGLQSLALAGVPPQRGTVEDSPLSEKYLTRLLPEILCGKNNWSVTVEGLLAFARESLDRLSRSEAAVHALCCGTAAVHTALNMYAGNQSFGSGDR
eukprot:4900148-Amphidinium_carterae.1